MDDSCLLGTSLDSCWQNVDMATLLDELGFNVHPEKSIFTPTCVLVYLGFLLNSLDVTVSLTREKAQKIIDQCKAFMNRKTCTIRECAGILGLLVASEPGVDFAPLHYKRIEHEKVARLQRHAGDFETIMTITPIIKEDLLWWVQNAHQAKHYIRRGHPHIQLFSDSSDFACGGVRGDVVTGGPWVGLERYWHINEKELKQRSLH